MDKKKQAMAPLYIRFGEIPEDCMSHVHRGDSVIRAEGGLSVWRAINADGRFYPMLPDDPNSNTLTDYFDMMIMENKHVYLVTGREMFLEGADREPLLMPPVIVLGEITHYYRTKFFGYGDDWLEKHDAKIKAEHNKEYEEEYSENLKKRGCGYWTVCHTHDCPCSPSAPVNQGFNPDTWEELRKAQQKWRVKNKTGAARYVEDVVAVTKGRNS